MTQRIDNKAINSILSSKRAPIIPFGGAWAEHLQSGFQAAARRCLGDSASAAVIAVDTLQIKTLTNLQTPDIVIFSIEDHIKRPVGLAVFSKSQVLKIAIKMSGAVIVSEQGGRSISKIEWQLAAMFVGIGLREAIQKLRNSGVWDADQPLDPCAIGTDFGDHLTTMTAKQLVRVGLDLSENKESEATGDTTMSIYIDYDICKSMSMKASTLPPSAPTAEASEWQGHMQQVALATHIPARCVLDTFSLATAAVSRLRAGDILALPGLTLQDITLQLPHGQSNLTFAHGKLGALRRYKALKLIGNPGDSLQGPALGIADLSQSMKGEE